MSSQPADPMTSVLRGQKRRHEHGRRPREDGGEVGEMQTQARASGAARSWERQERVLPGDVRSECSSICTSVGDPGLQTVTRGFWFAPAGGALLQQPRARIPPRGGPAGETLVLGAGTPRLRPRLGWARPAPATCQRRPEASALWTAGCVPETSGVGSSNCGIQQVRAGQIHAQPALRMSGSPLQPGPGPRGA